MKNLLKSISKRRFVLYFLSSIIFCLCIFYTIEEIITTLDIEKLGTVLNKNFFSIFLTSILFATSHIFFSLAWKHLINNDSKAFSSKNSVTWHSYSQIFKYLPGPFLQHLGRHGIGLRMGINNKILIQSAVLDLIISSLAAVPYSFTAIIYFYFYTNIFTIVLLPLTALLIFYLIKFFLSKFHSNAHVSFIYFFISQFILLVTFFVLNYFLDVINLDLTTLIMTSMIYVLAWLIGMLTVGVPAGIGVREAVMIYFLNNLLNQNDVIILVILMRAVCIVGDLIAFMYSIKSINKLLKI